MKVSGINRAVAAAAARQACLLRAALLVGTASFAVFSGTISARAQSSLASVSYSIPSGKLSTALTRWAQASGVKLLAPAGVLQGRSTSGLTGSHSPQDALSTLLVGTGLTYTFSGSTVTISGSSTNGDSGAATLPGAIALDTIDVGGSAAGNSADLPFQTPGSSAHISSEEMQRVVGESTADIFKDTPGVLSGSSRNGASLNPNIRGLQGMNRVATSIDGAEQATSTYRGYYGVDNRTYLDPDLMGGVSINKGPSGSGQGASAIGGSVAAETLNAGDILQDGKTYGVRLRGTIMSNSIEPMAGITQIQNPEVAGQDYGRDDRPDLFDFNGKSGSFAAAYAKENVELVGGVSRRKNGNYFAGTHGPTTYQTPNGLTLPLAPDGSGPGTEILNTSEDSLSTLLKGTVRFGDGHKLVLSHVHYESDYGEVTPALLRGTANRQIPLSDIDTDTFTARYAWKPAFTELIDLKVNSWFTNTDENSLVADSIMALKRKTNSETFGINGANTSRFGTTMGELAVSYGGSYVIEQMEPSEPITNNSQDLMAGTREITSAFTKGEFEPWKWLKIDGGLQYMSYKSEDDSGYAGTYSRPAFTGYSGDELSPNFGITVTPMEGVQLFAKYTEGYRPPSMRESTWNSSGYYFNPDLKPEHAKNWEFGANYLASGLVEPDDKLRLKLAYFDNETEDYIGRSGFSQVAPNVFIWAYKLYNLDSVTLKGLEFTASYDARKYFVSTALNYYTDFEYCRTAADCTSGSHQSDYMANQVPPKFMASTTFGMRFFDEKLTLGARHTFVDESIGEFLLDPTDFGTYTLLPWPSYHLFDLFAEWEVSDELQFSFNADNITDRYYIDPLSNAVLPAPGRTLRASMTMKY